MTHANEDAREEECSASQVLRAFRALEQGMPIAGRHITREVAGAVEIGRDCPLEQWMLALEIGLFREEWLRQREKASLMLAKVGDVLIVPRRDSEPREAWND